ncbi:33 kDa inner dynein arm light chain, axonemal-like [Convolutriloba macropyga]|uniref:33 kDa inner dynein arm light chain, axonemal-like n=1 Tax=Convolutriloba macropyga TaxID=536237 RepID=UPI003F51B3DE
MTMHEFESLYQSSVGYGMRKALSGQQNRQDVNQEIEDLQLHVKQLKNKLDELNERSEQLEVEEREGREERERRHREASEDISDTNQKLKTKLKTLLGTVMAH